MLRKPPVNELSALLKALAPPAPGARLSLGGLMASGAVAGAIKLLSAALSFLMFVAIAMVTDVRSFGLFSATYAGASLVSFFAVVGQHSAALRFWPQYAGAGDLPTAHAFMARSILVSLGGMVVSSLGIAAIGFVPALAARTPAWQPLCLSAALLNFALSWSEFASCAYRAKGRLVSGLMPRDVVWRALTIAAVFVLEFAHLQIDAVGATLMTAAILILVTLRQSVVLVRETVLAERAVLTPAQKAEFNDVTMGLWGVTSLPAALGQVATLLVAAILGPEIAGAVFVADRTTRLVVLALTGINQALAPEISGAFYGGDRAHVQKITSLTALGSGLIALVILAAFWVGGPFILSIFDRAYATPEMHAVLLLFGTGATITAACGPIELLMQLTGLQHALLRLIVIVNAIGFAVTALATWYFGAVGAAAALAVTVVTWNVWALLIARRRIGIDPSVLGLTFVGLAGLRRGRNPS